MKTFWSGAYGSISLIVVGCVLAVGGLLQVVVFHKSDSGESSGLRRPLDLSHKIPGTIPDWTVKDEPLGPTEAVQSVVVQTLNYDDVVYRVYARADERIGVYVAYWSPGRMPTQRVAEHTPDGCWTSAGWTCTKMRFADVITAGDMALRPGQWRLFRAPQGGAQEYVVYWQLVGHDLYDFGRRFNYLPNPLKWWRDVARRLWRQPQPQYFIRLSSNRPFGDLRDDPGFQQIVRALARLGLEARGEDGRW